MRICKDVQILDVREKNILRAESNERQDVFTCSGCMYQSNRQFNLLRHEERIHSDKKLRKCCGKRFNKGDYYVHCELVHPEKRAHAITSKEKYKITKDTIKVTTPYLGRSRSYQQTRPACNVHVGQRYSERIRSKNLGKMKSKVSVEYSITYSEIDMENIPLITFLTDPQLKSYLRKLPSAKLRKDTGNARREESTLKIAISSERNIEKAVSRNDEESVRTKVSDSAESSLSVELPAKKLILQRFRTSIEHEFKIPLREQNNNSSVQLNFAGTQPKESRPAFQSWTKNSKRFAKENKENISKFSFSLQQQLSVKLDRGITVPMVTELHRDFLSHIDFDQYKIF